MKHRLMHRLLYWLDRSLADEIRTSISLNRWVTVVTQAIYGGRARPEADADQVRALADILDTILRATQRLIAESDDALEIEGGVTMQDDLRRIADRLEAIDADQAATVAAHADMAAAT